MLGNFIGGIILVIAPGNYMRLLVIGNQEKNSILEKFYALLSHIVRTIDVHILLSIGLLFILLFLYLQIKNKQKHIVLKVMMYLGFLMATLFMYLSAMPYALGSRMLMLPLFIFFLLWMSAMVSVFKDKFLSLSIYKYVFIFCNISLFSLFIYKYHDLYLS
jgi:hypothetical protein